jgi:hypothetical protein
MADDFGSSPAITLIKEVDGHRELTAPGLPIPAGTTVTFTYVVTNTGNVNLNAVNVSDNVLGPIACPQKSLAPNQSETCTETTTARTGTHTNIGTVTAQPVDPAGQSIGAAASATDPASYTGTPATKANENPSAPAAASPSTPGAGPLAFTGIDGTVAGGLTVAMIGLGLFFVGLSRRRHSTTGRRRPTGRI